MNNKRNFLITGGNFTNKGAQSMLMITVAEIKKRFRNTEIYVLPVDDYRLYDKKNLKFNVLHNHQDLVEMDGSFLTTCRLLLKNIVRFTLRKEYIFGDLLNYYKTMKNVDCIIDISGFCLSSQFGNEYNMMLLNTINEGIKYHIPVVLMPQSFGPFEYGENKDLIIKKMNKLLPYPYIIYTREEDGYNLLANTFNLNNIQQSTDLVLQNTGIDLEDIFYEVPPKSDFDIKGKNNVALIPNSMNLMQGNAEVIVALYRTIIKELLDRDKHVYILYHSTTDKEFCEEIISVFNDTDNLIFTSKDINCYEYDEIVKKFNYIIASRYHSIVHAYRYAVPCLIIGWAVKYHSLAKIFGQENMVLDTRKDIDEIEIVQKISMLDKMFGEYRVSIEKKLPDIQKDNCFNVLDILFNEDRKISI